MCITILSEGEREGRLKNTFCMSIACKTSSLKPSVMSCYWIWIHILAIPVCMYSFRTLNISSSFYKLPIYKHKVGDTFLLFDLWWENNKNKRRWLHKKNIRALTPLHKLDGVESTFLYTKEILLPFLSYLVFYIKHIKLQFAADVHTFEKKERNKENRFMILHTIYVIRNLLGFASFLFFRNSDRILVKANLLWSLSINLACRKSCRKRGKTVFDIVYIKKKGAYNCKKNTNIYPLFLKHTLKWQRIQSYFNILYLNYMILVSISYDNIIR